MSLKPDMKQPEGVGFNPVRVEKTDEEILRAMTSFTITGGDMVTEAE